MKPLEFDNGVEEFSLGSGVFRVNPRDPGVLSRFFSLKDRFDTLQIRGNTDAQRWQEADRQCRQLLDWVFPGNDFSQLLGTVNLLSLCQNGSTVFTNFVAAVAPLMAAGMREFSQQVRQDT